MSLQSNIGNTIKKIRKQMGMSQEQLALTAEIDRRYMSDIENGKRNISLDIIERLAKSLDISVSKLIKKSEDLNSENEYNFTSIDELKQWLCDNDYKESIVFENPDYISAVIGIDYNGRVIYDYDLMVEYFAQSEEINYEEAVEFIDFNTVREIPYMGENAPIILYHTNI